MSSPQTQRTAVGYQLSGTGGVAKKGNGTLTSIFCSSTSAGTVAIYDGATTSDTTKPLVPQFSPAAGVNYAFDLMFQVGLNIVVGGTLTGVAGYV